MTRRYSEDFEDCRLLQCVYVAIYLMPQGEDFGSDALLCHAVVARLGPPANGCHDMAPVVLTRPGPPNLEPERPETGRHGPPQPGTCNSELWAAIMRIVKTQPMETNRAGPCLFGFGCGTEQTVRRSKPPRV